MTSSQAENLYEITHKAVVGSEFCKIYKKQ